MRARHSHNDFRPGSFGEADVVVHIAGWKEPRCHTPSLRCDATRYGSFVKWRVNADSLHPLVDPVRPPSTRHGATDVGVRWVRHRTMVTGCPQRPLDP